MTASVDVALICPAETNLICRVSVVEEPIDKTLVDVAPAKPEYVTPPMTPVGLKTAAEVANELAPNATLSATVAVASAPKAIEFAASASA